MEEQKITNYFYIDESGSISNNQKLFIHGCVKTDRPDSITEALKELFIDIVDDKYFEEFRDVIIKQGFHACENHPDIWHLVYKLIAMLEYRSYFVIINKESEFFKSKGWEEHQWFSFSLKKLLKDRIISNKGERNIFYFEDIQIAKKKLPRILDEIFTLYKEQGHDVEYYIVGKEEENLVVTDYLNYIFFHIFAKDQPWDRIKQNFNLVSSKIALIHFIHNNVYLSRKKSSELQITLDNLIEKYGEVAG
ncbi:MAG: hypothetical protein WEA99_04290 [Brumimicrobium sp.]